MAPLNPPRPALVVLLMSMVNSKQPLPLRLAVLYCTSSWLHKNESAQSQLVQTLLPSEQPTGGVTARVVKMAHSRYAKNFEIFDQNFHFWENFRFLTKISIFEKNFDFWPELRFLRKNSISDQNFYFWPKFRFLTKNFDFWPKFPFWSKFRFFTKISIFHQNFDFSPKFRFLPKISIFDKCDEHLYFY